MISFQSASVTSWIGRNALNPPAYGSRMSTGPSSSSVRATIAATCSPSVHSAAMPIASAPAACSSETSASIAAYVATVDGNANLVGGEHPAACRADALRAAGYQRDLAGEVRIGRDRPRAHPIRRGRARPRPPG